MFEQILVGCVMKHTDDSVINAKKLLLGEAGSVRPYTGIVRKEENVFLRKNMNSCHCWKII